MNAEPVPERRNREDQGSVGGNTFRLPRIGSSRFNFANLSDDQGRIDCVFTSRVSVRSTEYLQKQEEIRSPWIGPLAIGTLPGTADFGRLSRIVGQSQMALHLTEAEHSTTDTVLLGARARVSCAALHASGPSNPTADA